MSELTVGAAAQARSVCSALTDSMCFNLGNALECLWQADRQPEAFALLQQARQYIDREMRAREMKA